MPGSDWRFVLTNLEGFRVDEIANAYERKYTANLSKPSTASFQIRRDNPIVPYLFSREEDYLLQIWQGSTLRMWGPILTANLAMTEGSPPTIAVTAADPMWRMSRRFYWGTGVGFVQNINQDKVILARGLLGFQQGRKESGNFASLGIAVGEDLCGSSGTYTIQTGKSGLTGIQELAQGFDGFDWYMEPVESPLREVPYAPYIANFRAAAVVGSEKLGAVFEFGTGRRNMRSVNYLRDQTSRANSILNLSEEGFEPTALNTAPVINRIDKTNWERFGLYEDMAELSGVPSVSLREKYTEEALAVRKNPRYIMSMTSDINDETGRVPVFGSDYWLGDTVTARAVIEDDVILFNGAVRVYSVEVAINNAGTATYTPILIQEGE